MWNRNRMEMSPLPEFSKNGIVASESANGKTKVIPPFQQNEVQIRRMEIRDMEEVLDIEQVSSITPWSRRAFMDELTHPLSSSFILCLLHPAGDRIAGFIVFRNVGDESELLDLSVHPLQRKIGFGARLLQFYLDRCSQAGVRRSYLEVAVSNEAALRLYRSFCYEQVGLRKNFYGGKIDALLLSRRI
jgi:[ribosomal protein S18]-alanine N-acetyltransferase